MIMFADEESWVKYFFSVCRVQQNKKKKKTEIGGYTEQVVLHFGQIPDLLISMTILALSRSCHAEVESWRPQHMLI